MCLIKKEENEKRPNVMEKKKNSFVGGQTGDGSAVLRQRDELLDFLFSHIFDRKQNKTTFLICELFHQTHRVTLTHNNLPMLGLRATLHFHASPKISHTFLCKTDFYSFFFFMCVFTDIITPDR